MACTIEKVLADARLLVNRLRDHDSQAETLIAQAQTLNKRVDAMKQVCIETGTNQGLHKLGHFTHN